MIDPYEGLQSFQKALRNRAINPKACTLYPELSLLVEDCKGKQRFTYALIDNLTVKATMVMTFTEFLNGIPCFQIGYSVAEQDRNKGFGKEIVKKSLEELKNGFKKSIRPINQYYVEAIVGVNNIASQKIASQLISPTPKEIIDEFSKEPAYQYIGLVK